MADTYNNNMRTKPVAGFLNVIYYIYVYLCLSLCKRHWYLM